MIELEMCSQYLSLNKQYKIFFSYTCYWKKKEVDLAGCIMSTWWPLWENTFSSHVNN